MKRLLTLIVAAAFLFIGTIAYAVHVKGYTRKDGTYVQPHERSAPNKTKNDNYSTKGNVNPYTGKAGTKPRDEEYVPKSEATTAPTITAPASPVATPQESRVIGWLAMRSGLPEVELKRQLGTPRIIDKKSSFEEWTYPTGTVFVKEGKVIAWKQIKSP